MIQFELTDIECRVLGALIEKEATTPDQYPMSLNGLTTACNQKSNREPVMSLTESEVLDTIKQLDDKYLVTEAGAMGRVTKYKHRFCNTEFGGLQLSKQELGIICVMLLRGPQTPGELRTRTNRLCEFKDVTDVERVLQSLQSREDGPFVVMLPRQPGKREARYMHLFAGEVDVESYAQESAPSASGGGNKAIERLAVVEQELESLKAEVAELKAILDDLMS
jgi:uncharacterized protein YceH (UPF0502 family)